MAEQHPVTEALRQRSRQLWHTTLVEDLRTGEHGWRLDSRDLMVVLAPYHHCAALLGMPVALSFRVAAWRGPASIRGTVVAFGRRRDVRLDAFGWALTGTPDEPAYVSTLPAIDTDRLLRRFGRDVGTSGRERIT